MSTPTSDQRDVDDLAKDGEFYQQVNHQSGQRERLSMLLTPLIDETVDHRQNPFASPNGRRERWVEQVPVPEPLVVERRKGVGRCTRITDGTGEVVLERVSQVVGVTRAGQRQYQSLQQNNERT